ncbi:fibroblast growth factor 20-like isoform X2 [Antedon mediterranea]
METKKEAKLITKQLYARTRFHLAISEDGTVTSNEHEKNKIYTHLNIDSPATGIVTIRGEKTGYYVAMNDTGVIYSSTQMTKDCEFKENHLNSYLHYSRDLDIDGDPQTRYLAISNHGNVKSVIHCRSSVRFIKDTVKS